MATITSAQSGNFSATSTWVGGVVPTAADIAVAATGHTVAIDTDVTVTEFQQVGTGKFTLGNGRTVSGIVRGNAGSIASGATIDCTATTSATINGNVIGSSTTSTTTAVRLSGTGTLTINGNITGGTGPTNSAYGVYIPSAGTLFVFGNTTGGSGTLGHAITTDVSGATINITGNVSAGAGNTSRGIESTAITTINVTGNVNGGGSNNANGIRTTGGASTVTVIGNVTSGAGTADCSGIYCQTGASPTVTITGTVSGASGGIANVSHGVHAEGASATVTVIGSIIAVGTGHGIRNNATSNGVIFQGNLTDSTSGFSAVFSRLLRITATNDGVTTYANAVGFPNGTPVSRVSPNLITGMPASTNVRSGTTYGYNSELTGSLAVPPASSVASGVPVDNTVGNAVLSPSDLAEMIGAQIAAAVSSPPAT